jgi:hypothetical protein
MPSRWHTYNRIHGVVDQRVAGQFPIRRLIGSWKGAGPGRTQPVLAPQLL